MISDIMHPLHNWLRWWCKWEQWHVHLITKYHQPKNLPCPLVLVRFHVKCWSDPTPCWRLRWVSSAFWVVQILKVAFFFRKCNAFFKSPKPRKKIFHITILNLNFEFPVHNSQQVIQISSSRLWFGIFFLEILEIWKMHRTFWKKQPLVYSHFDLVSLLVAQFSTWTVAQMSFRCSSSKEIRAIAALLVYVSNKYYQKILKCWWNE